VTIYGTAGESARTIARRRRARARLVLLAVALGAMAIAAANSPAGALLLVLAGSLVAYRLSGRAFAADAGAATEVLVAARVRRARAQIALFDLDIRTQRSDIDVVVLGPMAATIEVKMGTGRVVAYDDGRVRVARAWLPGHPIAQAARHAATVGRYLDEHVTAVLCIAHMRGRHRYVTYGAAEVLLTNARRLPRVLRRLPNVLSPRSARRVAHNLRSGNNPSPRRMPSVH